MSMQCTIDFSITQYLYATSPTHSQVHVHLLTHLNFSALSHLVYQHMLVIHSLSLSHSYSHLHSLSHIHTLTLGKASDWSRPMLMLKSDTRDSTVVIPNISRTNGRMRGCRINLANHFMIKWRMSTPALGLNLPFSFRQTNISNRLP